MTLLLAIAVVLISESFYIWGPIIALIAAVTAALIAGKYQLKSADHAAKSQEDNVLLSGYNDLVKNLQKQVNEVQKDNIGSIERAIRAEETAHRAIQATEECERKSSEDRRAYQLQLDALSLKYDTDLNELRMKHDRELAALSREIAVIRAKQKES